MNQLEHDEIYIRRQDCIQSTIHINPKLLKIEAELMTQKHADYAFLSPAELTRMFRREYSQSFMEYFVKYYDHRGENKVLGLNSPELFENNPATLTSLWKARQQADRLGMLYDQYTRLAFKSLVEERRYKRYPRPSQLYSKHVVESVKAMWDEKSAGGVYGYGFPTTSDPRFKNQNFCNEPPQIAYRERQIRRIKGTTDEELKEKRMWLFSLSRQTLPVKMITAEFGLSRAELESKWDGKLIDFREGINEQDLRRPCYGLPTIQSAMDICKSCPMAEACEAESEIVKQRVIDKVDSLDPKADRKREQARERKRKQRERERAAKEKASSAVV